MRDGTTTKVKTLPSCSFCCNKARYDFRTVIGSWAYACDWHYARHRMYDTLGTGKGQYLEIEGEE